MHISFRRISTPVSVAALLALVLAALAGSSCGPRAFSSGTQKKMERVVTSAMKSEGIPGVIVGVWTPRGQWVKAFGEADVKTGRPMKLTDRVRIASNTKTFVATVVLQLAAEGKLSLSDQLGQYVPRVQNSDRITLAQVLNMTSGTFSFTEDEQFDAAFTADPLMKMTPDQQIDIALGHDPYFPPGAGYHYSDTNYAILGLIIEQVTGREVEDEVRQRVIEPLGLANTYFPETPDIPGEHPTGYVSKDGALADYTRVEPSVPWAGGAMISDLYDMKRWSEALASGELLDPETHRRQMETVPTGTGATRYGLGVLEIDGFIGHTGAMFGFSSVFLRDPVRDATFVVFANKATNSSSEAPSIGLELIKLVYPDVGK